MPKHNTKKDFKEQNTEEILRKKAENVMDKRIETKPLSKEILSSDETKRLLYELQVQKIELEMQNNELRDKQEELFDLNKRYVDLYNDAPVGYVTLSSEGKITETNAMLLNLLQVETQELLNQPFTKFIFNEDQDIYYLYCKNFFKENKTNFCSLRMIKSDGMPFFVSLTSKIRKFSDENRKIYLVINDINEQMKTEEALKAKEKMILVQSRFAVMGEMISMIAHQWRQPLSIISLRILDMKVKHELKICDKDYFNKQFDGIELSIKHMSDTIDDFRNFFQDDKEAVMVSLSKLVEGALEIIKPIIENKRVEIITEFLDDDVISIYQNEMKQVLLNIINNALDAFSQGEIENPIITIKTYKKTERYYITIQDNAGGIPDNIIDKIFDPYYTTKESYNGTGLGLYISKIIVDNHCKGSLDVKHSDGGALFTISLKNIIQ